MENHAVEKMSQNPTPDSLQIKNRLPTVDKSFQNKNPKKSQAGLKFFDLSSSEEPNYKPALEGRAVLSSSAP